MNPRTDLVAVILAFGIAAAIIIIAVGATFHRGSISENESNLLSTVLGAAIGAVATYLGLTRGGSLARRPPSEPEQSPAPQSGNTLPPTEPDPPPRSEI